MKDKIKELENQLKPCPFCGGRMRIVNSGDLFPEYDLACDTKDCMLEVGFGLSVDEKSLPKWIAKFNRRPQERMRSNEEIYS